MDPKTPEVQALLGRGTRSLIEAVLRFPDFQGVSPIPMEIGRQARMENDAGRNHLNLQAVEARADSSKPKLPRQDSNLDKESQNLLCYRYTTG